MPAPPEPSICPSTTSMTCRSTKRSSRDRPGHPLAALANPTSTRAGGARAPHRIRLGFVARALRVPLAALWLSSLAQVCAAEVFSLGLRSASPPLSAEQSEAPPANAPQGAAHELTTRLREDLRALAVAPLEWRASEWTRVGLAAGAVLLVGKYDESIHDAADRLRTPDVERAARAIRPLGREAGLALLAGTWTMGRVLDRPRWVALAQDGLEASLIASGLVTPALKAVAGRQRPRATREVSTFSPLSGGESFPSGESTQVFALAAVLAGHSDSAWVKGLAFGVAGLIGTQRIALDAHWASDVLAGALIGSSVGAWVVRRHASAAQSEGERRRTWAITPLTGPSGTGLGLGLRTTF